MERTDEEIPFERKEFPRELKKREAKDKSSETFAILEVLTL